MADETNDQKNFKALLARSSLGSPEVQRLAARTPDHVVDEILRRVDRLTLWDRIHDYVEACGGDPGAPLVSSRSMDTLVALTAALTQLARDAVAELKAEHDKELNELRREHARDLRDCAAEARADAAAEYAARRDG